MGAERSAGAPPAWAERLARVGLPEELVDAILGDLEEDYRARRLAAGRLRADLRYWADALALRRGALRRAARRLRSVRPTWETSRPRRARHNESDPWRHAPMSPQDVKYAVRRLLRSPGFTLVAILSLALGIGANTAIFSVVDSVLFRSLPIERPEELVEVYTSDSDGYPYAMSSFPDYQDLRERVDVFTDVVGTRTFLARLETGGRPQLAFGELISWDYFQVLGIPMALGRPFLEEEDRTPGTHAVVILGYRTWVGDYGADPDVLGTTIQMNGRAFTVVGVAPKSFTGTMPVMATRFFAPLMMTNELMGASSVDQLRRGSRSMFMKARLRDGVTVEQANAALEAFAAGLAEVHPETNEHRLMSALPSSDVSLHPVVDRALVPVAGFLMAVVGLVLLIACANLASFLLARAEDRRKEIAVRLALGAGRGVLVRQLLVESVFLALLGGAGGVLLARWTLDLLMAFKPPIPIPVDLVIGLDGTVLAFTAAVSVVAGIAFGLVPALQATNPDVSPTLKDEVVGSARPGRLRLRNLLVVAQVSFSFVLLIGAGLFVRSLQKAQSIDPGFYTGPAAMVWPMPEMSGYEDEEEKRVFYQTLEERLRAHPLVSDVALTDRVPLGSVQQSGSYVVPGRPSEAPEGDWDIDNATVMPGYFRALEVPILQGRAFEDADLEVGEAIVVSEAFVGRFFPGEDVVGRTIERGQGRIRRIVGVAADTKVRTLGEDPRPYVYEISAPGLTLGMQAVVRGPAAPDELLAAALSVVEEIDPDMVMMEAQTMNEHLALMLFAPRMAALLLTVFGGLALVLAAIGIYGVVSYSVSRRTRELGIRMSLGASARNVVAMAVGGGMRLVLAGGAVGVVLAAAVTWLISDFLYGISSTDVATFVAIPVLLSGVALLAAFVPARRASSVDPVRALRAE